MYVENITHSPFIFLALLSGKIDHFRAVANSMPHTRVKVLHSQEPTEEHMQQ